MSPEDFNRVAAGFPEPFRLLVKDSVESTNDEALALVRAGAKDGLIVLAERQTAGRGRRGAAWFSPSGESLAFSIVIRPAEPKVLWPRLALAAGLAVAEAIERFGVHTGIKWPNDVWIGGRKVAGILVEAGPDFAVIGIGLNVNTISFPAGVAEIATSLQIETGFPLPREEVLAAIIEKFALRRGQIGDDFEGLIKALGERCVLTGKRISLTTAGGQLSGTMEGISPAGELLLRTATGVERLIKADEVRFLAD